VVSLVVGVMVGVLVFRLNERLPGLEYQIVASAIFSGEKERIGLFAVNVANPAGKEVEGVTCEVNLRHLDLQETKITGIPQSAYSQTVKDGVLRLEVPYLNPQETFTLQLLVTTKEPEIEIPKPNVRAKGLVGVERSGRRNTDERYRCGFFSGTFVIGRSICCRSVFQIS
jgi:hypothetical protein